MNWLFQQFVGWQEIVKDIVLIAAALYVEDWLDEWRQRRRTAKWMAEVMAAGSKALKIGKHHKK